MMLAIPALPGAFAHGGMQAPSADFSGKKATMFVKLDPPVVTSAGEPVFINARFFDEATNENFKEVTYRFFFKKDGVEIPIKSVAGGGGDSYGGQGFFYDPDGNVELKIVPKDTAEVTAYGYPETQFGGVWNRGEPIVVEGPVFTEPGLYNLFIEIWTEKSTRTLVDPPLQYDIWVTPGREETIPVGSQSIMVRNYYGAISESDYDDATKTISFSMPFDWQSDMPTRIGMLHTEVFIPKELSDFDRESLKGTVNGFGVPVFVDNYGEEETVVHFTISRKNLEDLQGRIKADNASPEAAVFALSPPDPESEVKVMQVASESANYSVSLTIPEEIFPQQAIPFGVRITDKQGNPVSAATYELVIRDNAGNELSRSGGSTTPEGLSSQDVNFDAQGSFTVSVEKINATNESVQSSIQVVPEFPVAALAASLGIAGAVAYGRFRGFFAGKAY
ncbi:hypothetical protein [Nitrososphaera sp.]|uniref:hypothetical protein n=1 Tax=Nitrososphaera sp. TaxID=1971748 RepID=UPI0031794EEE